MEADESSIILEVEYEGEEIARQVLVGFKGYPWYKRIWLKPHIILVSLIPWLIAIYAFGWLNFCSALLALVFVTGMRTFFFPYLMERISKSISFYERRVKSERGISHTIKTKYLLNDVGVRIESDCRNEVTAWHEITGANKTRTDICIYYSECETYLSPKTIFQTFDELYFFKEFVSQRIGARAAL